MTTMIRFGWLFLTCSALLILMACRSEETKPSTEPTEAALPPLDEVAEGYVKLVLAVGQHDENYVDAFYGPSSWREEAEVFRRPLDEVRQQAEELIKLVSTPIVEPPEEIIELRRRYLARQLAALIARVSMLQGEGRTFDEESQALYNAVAPHHDEAFFQTALDELDHALRDEGFTKGSLTERYEAFRQGFVIPPDKVDEVFQTAIEACREHTEAFLDLPEDESFVVEYVTDKPWSGYNWYQGGYYSRIQVNLDLPIYIDRAVDLACHEGYPGHHAYNTLLEKNLVNDRGWIEYTVYPLFSPQSLIAEGSANYGIEMAFPGAQRQRYEEEVLFPMAGLEAKRAASYYRIQDLSSKLKYAGNEAARRYLDGEIDAEAAIDWLVRYAAYTPARAEQRLRFIETYRSYVINYNLGEDLVKAYIERVDDQEEGNGRWQAFEQLLSTPRLPADLL